MGRMEELMKSLLSRSMTGGGVGGSVHSIPNVSSDTKSAMRFNKEHEKVVALEGLMKDKDARMEQILAGRKSKEGKSAIELTAAGNQIRQETKGLSDRDSAIRDQYITRAGRQNIGINGRMEAENIQARRIAQSSAARNEAAENFSRSEYAQRYNKENGEKEAEKDKKLKKLHIINH
jgi:hypothetical protein